LDPWLLAVVTTLATDGRLSSLKYALSGESVLPVGVWVRREWVGRRLGDSCDDAERLSLESL
jgi:hypothetical protein